MEIDGQEVDIEQLKDNWAMALMSKGVIVKLSLNMWRGNVLLTSEDLGLRFVDEDMTDFAKKYLQFGTKKVLPPAIATQFRIVERKARTNLKDHSFDTTWGRFVPFTAFSQWHEINDAHRQDFLDVIKGVSANYEEIVLSVKNDYKNLARDVWARLYPDDTAGPTPSYTEDFVNRVIEKIPEREELIKTFNFNTTYLSIPVPTLVEDNLDKAANMAIERKDKIHRAAVERNAREEIAQDYVQRKNELIDGFLSATVYSMRENISSLCDAVITSVGQRADGSLTRLHIKRIHNLINSVNVLNFYDDEEIKSLMIDLRAEIDKFKGERNDDIVVSKLKKLVDVTTKELTPEDFNPSIQYLEV